jgi:hypothetical protein
MLRPPSTKLGPAVRYRSHVRLPTFAQLAADDETCAAAAVTAVVTAACAADFAQLRWQRSAPLFATEVEGVSGQPQPEHIRDGRATLADFENAGKCTHSPPCKTHTAYMWRS